MVYASHMPKDTVVNAGEQMVLFLDDYPSTEYAWLIHSYGMDVLFPVEERGKLAVKIPRLHTEKKGIILVEGYLSDSKAWECRVQSLPKVKDSPLTIEAYCGPKHLVVGNDDFAMISATALDQYDNPLNGGTMLDVNFLVEGYKRVSKIVSDGLVAFTSVFSPSHRGYGALSVNYGATGSKEFRLDFYSNDPLDYKLFLTREHEYADGNQLVQIQTSKLLDRFGNSLENGTLIYFNITDSKGKTSIATGETIDGNAAISLPAPLYETSWTITSSIPGYARSTPLMVQFSPSVADFDLSHQGRLLKIGPILGHMGQYLKDGTLVNIQLQSVSSAYNFDLPVENGMTELNYHDRFVSPGTYLLEVRVGEVMKRMDVNVNYE